MEGVYNWRTLLPSAFSSASPAISLVTNPEPVLTFIILHPPGTSVAIVVLAALDDLRCWTYPDTAAAPGDAFLSTGDGLLAMGESSRCTKTGLWMRCGIGLYRTALMGFGAKT